MEPLARTSLRIARDHLAITNLIAIAIPRLLTILVVLIIPLHGSTIVFRGRDDRRRRRRRRRQLRGQARALLVRPLARRFRRARGARPRRLRERGRDRGGGFGGFGAAAGGGGGDGGEPVAAFGAVAVLGGFFALEGFFGAFGGGEGRCARVGLAVTGGLDGRFAFCGRGLLARGLGVCEGFARRTARLVCLGGGAVHAVAVGAFVRCGGGWSLACVLNN